MFSPHSRARNFRLLATLTLLAVAPGLVVIIVLSARGGATLLELLLGVVITLGGAAGVNLILLRDLTRLQGWVQSLLEQTSGPPRSPDLSTEPARLLELTIARVMRGSRNRRRALTRKLARADAIIDALADPVILIDRGRIVLRVNRAAEAAFGKNLAGRDFGHTLRRPAVLQAIDRLIETGKAQTVTLSQPAPVARTFELRAEPFQAEDAEGPIGLLTLHDVTALRRVNELRADFIANASHELRTPLSALIGFIEILQGPANGDQEARDRFLRIMDEQARRMSRLVDDLMSLSRIEEDEHKAPAGRVDLAALLRRALDVAEIKAAEKEMRLRLDLPAEEIWLTGDADQLTQVFQNLLDNAIAYSPPGGVVKVLGEWIGEGARRAIRISVVDQGAGIPKIHLSRLTERFYRVDPARSRSVGGTGLGLAIVKHIVNRHRGALAIDSEEGKGSVFAVTLPASQK